MNHKRKMVFEHILSSFGVIICVLASFILPVNADQGNVATGINTVPNIILPIGLILLAVGIILMRRNK